MRYSDTLALAPLFRDLRVKTPDITMLRICRKVYGPAEQAAHDNTQDRLWFLRAIPACAENGQVAIVVGGMDCDCVRYEGHVYRAPATVKDVEAAIEDLYYYAEGPIHWEIMKPSEAAQVKRESRDLIMEAFENGHAWSVTY